MKSGFCGAVAAAFVGLVLAGCGGGSSGSDGSGGSETRSSNANLSSLVLSAGALQPGFSKETLAYSAEVDFAVGAVTVTATAEDGAATITVQGAAVPSGTASQAVSLTMGANPIAVVVTAADGTTTRTYAVSVSRDEVDAGPWVTIAPGTFTMGSPTTEPYRNSDEVQHEVTLTRGFVMLATEVTQGEFEKRMAYNPSFFEDCGEDCPVEQVTWHEAAAYCNALSAAAGLTSCYECTAGATSSAVACGPRPDFATAYECPGYRLPTEAEWEYAARAGDQRATYGGDLTDSPADIVMMSAIAWHWKNSNGMTHAVGEKAANDWRLFDMLGNVWEWSHDWYGDYETAPGPVVDPAGSSTGSSRVLRGGSWYWSVQAARAANRDSLSPIRVYSDVGLRPVRSLP